jgi:CheY-like chemotaxis protein
MPFDTNLRITVVDDYWQMSRLIRAMLEDFGFRNIDEVTGAELGLRKLHALPYGLVISDLNMKPR